MFSMIFTCFHILFHICSRSFAHVSTVAPLHVFTDLYVSYICVGWRIRIWLFYLLHIVSARVTYFCMLPHNGYTLVSPWRQMALTLVSGFVSRLPQVLNVFRIVYICSHASHIFALLHELTHLPWHIFTHYRCSHSFTPFSHCHVWLT